MRTRIVAIACIAGIAGAASLTGCSGSGGDAAASTTAECTTAVLQPVVDSSAEALGRGNTMPIGDLTCADGWAVATGTLEPKGEPATFIFEGQGDTWIWQEPDVVCGNSADSSSVPASLFDVACAG